MAFQNPMLEAEPFEESQGTSPPPATPDDFKAFYSDMERQETLQRKLSRSKSGSKSIWSRKSLRKSTSVQIAAEEVPPPQVEPHTEKMVEKDKEKSYETKDIPNIVTTIAMSKSIIPDPLRDVPSWYNKEGLAAVPTHRTKYPIHNPFGPRWYKNQHLIPPSQLRPPPSIFSPSFPSLSPSTHERSEDQSRIPGPSRTPSGSPLPTPTSSQTGIAENGGKPRSRKTSQTAHDPVDLLDVTDPWGTNWHHQSPYDMLNANAVVPEPAEPRVRPSNSTQMQNRRKTVTPSPLSQSTTTVHLQSSDMDGNHLSHKLSKRRRPVLGGFFGNQAQESIPNVPQAMSLPTTPLERTSSPPKADEGPKIRNVWRPHSALPPPTASIHSNDKKGKRTSVLGRLAKTFSLLRKPSQNTGHGSAANGESYFHRNGAEDAGHDDVIRPSLLTTKQLPAVEQGNSVDPLDRVLPPVGPVSSPTRDAVGTSNTDNSDLASDRSSASLSVEPPFSSGKLTITNPDSPPPEDSNTPSQSHLLDLASEPARDIQPHQEQLAHSVGVAPSTQPVVQQRLSASKHESITASFPTGVDLTRSSPHSEVVSPPASYVIQSGKSQPNESPVTQSSVSFPVAAEAPLPDIPSMSLAAMLSGSPLSLSGSPMSTASLYVHPPTPHVPVVPIPDHMTVPTAIPTQPSLDPRPSAQDPSPTKASTPISRQTETFKLIKTSSGGLDRSDTIMVAGQHWEIVESDSRRRSKTKDRPSKSKEREGSSRKDYRHQERSMVDSVESGAERRSSQARQRSANGRTTDSTIALPPTPPGPRERSEDTRKRRGSTPSVNEDEHKPNRRRDEDRERMTDRRHQDGETRPININKPQPPPPPLPGVTQLDRRLSASARPTSELPSAAELNALRARDAWDMERLWKGRSMYEAEPQEIPSSPMPVRMSVEYSGSGNRYDPTQASHGSSHTSVVVPTPFHGHPSYPNIYHSMPVAPPPIIYSPAHHVPQIYTNSPPSFPVPDVPLTTSFSRPPVANPLPEPPRESSYEPSPLPPPLNRGGGHAADYWTKYTSVTTAH